ncbi:MAG TPA: ABC transporter ATP-binding protein [Chloroflexota bacterium]|nr:ABC transporter ATP-binding protein [Chloroflexota bacterium]
MLQVRGLSAGYDAMPVLHDVSLDVADGETVAILGPNGHGKTTLLRAISGLIAPAAGTITFEGARLDRLPAHEIVARGVTHIPQGDLPFAEMTVLENLILGAYQKQAWAQRQALLERVFTIFPRLQERQKQMARSLSGGERRMLALGRGLMTGGRLLMIDEPSLGLAPILVQQVYETITRIKASGVAILLVEESMAHVPDLADRLYLLENGHLVREGSVQELLADEGLVAAYLGT